MSDEVLEVLVEKRPLVLLSGGLDSTYLAYSMLQNENIDVLYVSGAQGEDKIAAEQQALENIYKWFEKHCEYKIIVKHHSDVSNIYHNADLVQFGQPSMWLMAALNAYDSNHKSVNIAYVCGDQIMAHIPNIQSAWNSLVAFSKSHHIPLAFPLAFTRKSNFFSKIPESLRKLTWTCEIPRKLSSGKYRKCGKCVACSTDRIHQFAHRYSSAEIDSLIRKK